MNCSRPLVSVVIPVFNSEKYLCRCLDSVLKQSYSEIQLVCIDDGSTDASPGLLDSYASDYPDRLIVVHKINAGAASARNNGIMLSAGEFITFVDNDDWIDERYIETLVNAAVLAHADVVCSGYRRPNSEGRVLSEAIPRPTDEWGRYLVEAAWAKLYRTDFVRQNSLSFLDTNIDEDLYFSLPAIELAQHVEVISYCGYNWFWNSDSVSNTSQRTSKGLLFEETLEALLKMMQQKDIELTPILEHYFVRLITWFLFYTSRGDGFELCRNNKTRYAGWLDRMIPGWRNEKFATPFHPTGDCIVNRIAVWLFVKHSAIFTLAIKIYSRAR